MTYSVMTEGMTYEQRVEFDKAVDEVTGSGDHEGDAQRRAFALAYGEQD